MDRNKTKQDCDRDNRSRQLDPQQDAYWQSRGYDEKPEPRDPPTVTSSESSEKEAKRP